MLAYLEYHDPEMIHLDSEPENDSENHIEWLIKSMKARKSMIFNFSATVMCQLGEIVDDRKKKAK